MEFQNYHEIYLVIAAVSLKEQPLDVHHSAQNSELTDFQNTVILQSVDEIFMFNHGNESQGCVRSISDIYDH